MNKQELPLHPAVQLVTQARRIAFVCHEYPDGDDLGAMLALKLGLAQKKISVDVFALGKASENLLFLPGVTEVREDLTPTLYDLVVMFGCSDSGRAGFAALEQGQFSILNIDHHQDNKKFGDVNLVSIEAAATSEIVYYLLQELEVKITKPIAINILGGIFFDTGGFQHANTSAEVLEIAAEMMRRGAHIEKISYSFFGKSNLSKLRAWAKALENARFDREQQMVYSVVTEEELEEVGAGPEDLEGVVSILNTIPEARFSMLLKQRGAEIRGSLRSENYKKTDVAAIAKAFGGGGHKLAAGFKLKGKIEKTKDGWKIT